MVLALIVAASLASALNAERTPLTNADLRLETTARPSVTVGEFLTVRTTWTARHRIPLVVGGESVEVDAGRGFEPRAEGGELGVQCVFSAPESYAAGRSTVTEHLIGLEERDVPAEPDLSGLDRINASVGFVFDHPGRYRVRVRYDDAVSDIVDVDAVAPTGVDADLHVHTWHSGYNHDLPFLKSRDCFADPLAVYRAAKARGMDLVAITDHDSIDGGLDLLSRAPDGRDVILGEEVSCWLPVDGAGGGKRVEVHFGTWGMTETAHRELQPLRGNALEVAAYLRAAGIFFAFNHPLHFYQGQLPLERYLALLIDAAPAIETRNGAMLPAHNHVAAALARSRGKVVVGGSDAHTLRRVGTTWTAAPGATREEFLANDDL